MILDIENSFESQILALFDELPLKVQFIPQCHIPNSRTKTKPKLNLIDKSSL